MAWRPSDPYYCPREAFVFASAISVITSNVIRFLGFIFVIFMAAVVFLFLQEPADKFCDFMNYVLAEILKVIWL